MRARSRCPGALQQLYQVELILTKTRDATFDTKRGRPQTQYRLDYSHQLTQRTIGNVLRLQAQIDQIASGLDATSGMDPSVAEAVGNINVLNYLVTSFATQASAHLRKQG